MGERFAEIKEPLCHLLKPLQINLLLLRKVTAVLYIYLNFSFESQQVLLGRLIQHFTQLFDPGSCICLDGCGKWIQVELQKFHVLG